MRVLSVGVLIVLGLSGCSGSSGNTELGPGGDGPLPADVAIVDNGALADKGQGDTNQTDMGQTDTTQTDTAQTDTAQTDTGQTDIGSADTGTPQCDPNFGQPQACGGALSGTKWQYQSGCVADSAFDVLKQACATVQISQVAFSINATNSKLHFFANNTALQTFDGQITYKAFYPQPCVTLGCAAIQAALNLAMILYPGSSATCLQAGGGTCDCSVSLKLGGLGGGQWATNGGEVTVTAGGKPYPYHYCVNGNTLTFKGTPQNNDHHVTYIAQQTP